ncbi:PLDc N-terminal domain-containing protein [Humidisolicoccus flavus]|uniref:PLDc N-terminal domain-containing protein n=1 Tax=Humidisolicoccus flavus TaxID=3111414 RepID=UPI003244007E
MEAPPIVVVVLAAVVVVPLLASIVWMFIDVPRNDALPMLTKALWLLGTFMLPLLVPVLYLAFGDRWVVDFRQNSAGFSLAFERARFVPRPRPGSGRFSARRWRML